MSEKLSFRPLDAYAGLSSEAQKVVAAAKMTFGDDEKAELWLERPTDALGGVSPLEMIKSKGGSAR